MDISLKTDITIIGAGPAGATLSMFLSKHKIHHLIIDKSSFPREKTCGDGVTSEALKVLKEIDPDLLEEFIRADWVQASYGNYVEIKNGRNLFLNFKSENLLSAPYYIAKREIFDQWLISKLNPEYAKQRYACEVQSIERLNGKVFLNCFQNGTNFCIESNLIIGADGERSIVRKSFHKNGIKKLREHHMASLRCYYKGVEKQFENDPLETYLPNSNYRGYIWIFHMANGEANVGICAVSSDVAKLNLNLKEELERFLSSHVKIKSRFKNAEKISELKGWGIPLNSDAFEYTGDNYILLGDAAKFCEPASGKGIGLAMFSAFHALPTILKALKKQNFKKEILSEFETFFNNKYRVEWDKLSYWQNRMTKTFTNSFIILFLRIKPIQNYFKRKFTRSYNRFVHKA